MLGFRVQGSGFMVKFQVWVKGEGLGFRVKVRVRVRVRFRIQG